MRTKTADSKERDNVGKKSKERQSMIMTLHFESLHEGEGRRRR